VRRERIPVSAIASTQFMQSLFEEKLASQKEALLQGKQLADIIELTQPADVGPPSEGDASSRLSSASVLSTPAASRTVTGISVRRRRGLGVVAAVALPIVVAGAGGAYWYRVMRPAARAATTQSVTPPAIPVNRGALSVTSDPPGASIWISGDLRPEVTPATIKELPTGRAIDVKLTKDGFEQAKQSVTLTDGQPTSQVNLSLTKGSVMVDVSVTPATARPALLVDGKAYDGTTIDGLTSGDQHKLVVGASGYQDQTFTFMAGPQEKKHFDVLLQRETHRPSHGGVSVAQPAGTGKVNVGATGGWCNVSIDGVARGATPVAGIELPAGPHRVTCTAADHPAMTATVVVPVDGTARYRFTLQ
jgi:serine/threonine-protein kinase